MEVLQVFFSYKAFDNIKNEHIFEKTLVNIRIFAYNIENVYYEIRKWCYA